MKLEIKYEVDLESGDGTCTVEGMASELEVISSALAIVESLSHNTSKSFKEILELGVEYCESGEYHG